MYIGDMGMGDMGDMGDPLFPNIPFLNDLFPGSGPDPSAPSSPSSPAVPSLPSIPPIPGNVTPQTDPAALTVFQQSYAALSPAAQASAYGIVITQGGGKDAHSKERTRDLVIGAVLSAVIGVAIGRMLKK